MREPYTLEEIRAIRADRELLATIDALRIESIEPNPLEEIGRMRAKWNGELELSLAANIRLRELLRQGITAPSGAAICCCRNINAVKAGAETACWFCQARAAVGLA